MPASALWQTLLGARDDTGWRPFVLRPGPPFVLDPIPPDGCPLCNRVGGLTGAAATAISFSVGCIEIIGAIRRRRWQMPTWENDDK